MMETLQQFHFLRPEYLLLLLLLPVILWCLRSIRNGDNDWQKAIDSRLLRHLTPDSKNTRSSSWRGPVLVAWILISFALSGPTWEKKPSPVIQVQDNLIVVLDLSISMLASDVTPDRLTRGKQKIQDLLKRRKEGNTALIVFSGDSHVVTPLTDDVKTIASNLPALDPFIMPVIGSRPDLAVEQALSLIDQASVSRGRILMITDSIETDQAGNISEQLQDRPVTLSILAVGTAEGGPVNLPERGYLKHEGSVVIPKLDFSLLESIARQNGGNMARISLDDGDLDALDVTGARFIAQQQRENDALSEKGFDAWEDRGYLLLVVIIPLVLLAHRQGTLLVLLLCLLPWKPAQAFEWQDLWKTKDQQAAELLEQGDPEGAAELFESPEHKALSQFKAEKYEDAARTYSSVLDENETPDTSDLLYNKGNALAHQQKFEEALAAYDEALSVNPSHEDARFNKSVIEQYLEQQSQQNDKSDSENSENSESSENSENSDESQQGDGESSEDQSRERSQQNQQNNRQQDSGQNAQDQNQSPRQDTPQGQQAEQDSPPETEQNGPGASQTEQGDEAENEAQQQSQASQGESTEDSEKPTPSSQAVEALSEEDKQSFEQWMRRVPDDPGGLLRRKFEQQARERDRRGPEDGDPLW